jgi:RsiW-degrading membrane proteinase PrsW (M82 family)
MNRKIVLFGFLGLLLGLFVYDYFFEGIPVITTISGLIIIFGLILKGEQKIVSPIQIEHTNKCPNCNEPSFPKQRFCGMCGKEITITQNQIETELIPSVSQGFQVSTIGNIGKAFLNLLVPRNPLINVTDTIYSKLPPIGLASSLRLIIITALLFAGFYLLEFGNRVFYILDSYLAYFIATYSVALFYLIWVYRSDKFEREPFKFVLFIFAWGVFSGIIAGPLNMIMGPLFEASLGNAALIGPFTEEPLKVAGLYYLVTRERFKKEFNTPLDGIIYGFAAGLGFFAMENFYYFLNSGQVGGTVLVIRSFLTWAHGTWAATTGLWLGIAKVQRGSVIRADLVPGLLVAIVLHFLWNGWVGFFGEAGFFLQIAQMTFHLWYTRKIIKEAIRDEVLWGYGRGLAPKE